MDRNMIYVRVQFIVTLYTFFLIGVLDFAYLTGYDSCIVGESSRDYICFYFRKIFILIMIMSLSYGQSSILINNQISIRIYLQFVALGFSACWITVLIAYWIHYSSSQDIPFLFDKFIRLKLSTILELILPIFILFYFIICSIKSHIAIIYNDQKHLRLRMTIIGFFFIAFAIIWYLLKNQLEIHFYYFHFISQNFLITFGVHFPFFFFLSSLFLHIFIKRNEKCIASVPISTTATMS